MILDRFQAFHASSLAEAENSLKAYHGITYFDAARGQPHVNLKGCIVQIDGVTISNTSGNIAARADFPEQDFVRQYLTFRGVARLKFGDADTSMSANDMILVPNNTRLHFETPSSDEALVVRIQPAALRAKLAAIIGERVDRIGFDGGIGYEAKQQSRNSILMICSNLNLWGQHLSQTARNELSQHLIVQMLLCNMHNYSSQIFDSPPPPSNAQLLLVENFLEANWDKPIDIAIISEMSGVSARSLFRHFKKERQCSPSDFLRSLRLGHARTMLRNPEDATTVTGVAFKCCFQSLGHFAAAYRQSFGELPSETLRRSRRTRS